MKHTFIACFLLLGGLLSAQNDEASKQARVEEILEEKLRLPYEKLVQLYELKELGQLQEEVQTEAKQNKANSIAEKRLSNSTNVNNDEGEAFIAINPNDSNHLVVSYMEFNQTGMGTALKFPIYVSLDGGTTFTKSSFLTEDVFANDFPSQIIGGGGDPVFAFDNAGKLYFSWIYLGVDVPGDKASFTMNWASSADGGQTFSVEPDSAHFLGAGELTNLSGGGVISNNGDGIFDRQWMAVDNSGGPNDGRLYVSTLFIKNDSTKLSGEGTVVRYKEKTSATFEKDNLPVSNGFQTQFGNVAVDGNGTVHVVYTDIIASTIEYSNLSAGSLSFSTPVILDSNTNLFPSNRPYHNRINGAINMVCDPITDDLFMVNSDFGIRGAVKSYFRKSTNGGTTWSAKEDISQLRDSNIVFMPVVAAFGGNVSLSYYEVVDSSGFTTRGGVQKTLQSVDGGNTWLSSRTLSSDTTNFSGSVSQRWFGDYNNSIRTSCFTYSVWSDGRTGNTTRMYFAKTDNCQELSVVEMSPISERLNVSQVYPNPVKSNFKITIGAENANSVNASLVNLTGKVVQEWPAQEVQRGFNTVSFTVENGISAGTYLLQIELAGGVYTRKLVLQ